MCFSAEVKCEKKELEIFANAVFADQLEFPDTIYANSSLNLKNKIPVIPSMERKKIHGYYWGLIPRWFNPEKHKQSRPHHNARVETIHEKNSFMNAVKDGNFCSIIISGFYEPNKNKDSRFVLFTIKDQPLFFVAGLWEKWKDYITVTMVTCPGNDLVNQYHRAERMPLILSKEQNELWLNGELGYFQNGYELFPSSEMFVKKV